MTITLIKKMIGAGMHLGHRTRDWNPKTKRFIYMQKENVHLIDLVKSVFYLKKVSNYVVNAAAKGKTFLFVGTKKEAKQPIEEAAIACNSAYVTEKWLGGMLTNWATIGLGIEKLNKWDKQENQGQFEKLSKKQLATVLKHKRKLETYISGLRHMKKLPDVVIFVGQQEEANAINECKKLKIRTITILDTNCDPALTDLNIPGNDDAVPTIRFLTKVLCLSIEKGYEAYQQTQDLTNIQKGKTIYQQKLRLRQASTTNKTITENTLPKAKKQKLALYRKQIKSNNSCYLTKKQVLSLFDTNGQSDTSNLLNNQAVQLLERPVRPSMFTAVPGKLEVKKDLKLVDKNTVGLVEKPVGAPIPSPMQSTAKKDFKLKSTSLLVKPKTSTPSELAKKAYQSAMKIYQSSQKVSASDQKDSTSGQKAYKLGKKAYKPHSKTIEKINPQPILSKSNPMSAI